MNVPTRYNLLTDRSNINTCHPSTALFIQKSVRNRQNTHTYIFIKLPIALLFLIFLSPPRNEKPIERYRREFSASNTVEATMLLARKWFRDTRCAYTKLIRFTRFCISFTFDCVWFFSREYTTHSCVCVAFVYIYIYIYIRRRRPVTVIRYVFYKMFPFFSV